MRGSAAVQFSVQKFTVWHVGIAVAALLVAGVCGAWLMQTGAAWAECLTAMLLMLGAAAWLVRPLLHCGTVSIRWDGESWRVGPNESIAEDIHRGAVQIHLDVGAWLLLRFVPEKTSRRMAARWLPIQRQGSAQDWHALRCALYAPQPLSTSSGAESGGRAST